MIHLYEESSFFHLRSATCFGETLQMRYIPETKTSCIKDTGEKTSLQKCSRGTFFFLCQWRWTYPHVATTLQVR